MNLEVKTEEGIGLDCYRYAHKLHKTGPIEQYAVDLQDDQYGASGMWLFPKAA